VKILHFFPPTLFTLTVFSPARTSLNFFCPRVSALFGRLGGIFLTPAFQIISRYPRRAA